MSIRGHAGCLLRAAATALLLGCAWSAHAQDGAAAFNPDAAIQDPGGAAGAWLETARLGAFAVSGKVIIPTFRVVFAVKAQGAAHAGGGLGSRGSASVHGAYTLNGPDSAAMQAITDAVYERFVTGLKSRGVEVLPFETMPTALRERLLKAGQPAPVEFKRTISRGVSKEYRVYTAKGLPFYTTLHDPIRGSLGMGAQLSNIGWDALDYVESEMSGEFQATVLRPTFWVEFIDIEASGGMFSQRAQVGGEPGVKISTESELRLLGPAGLEKKPRPTGGTVWVTPDWSFGKIPVLGLKRTVQPEDSGLKGVEDTTSGAVAALQTATQIIGMLGGIGGGRRDKTFNVNVDPQKFQAAAQTTMGAVAELWAHQIAPRGVAAQTPQPAVAAPGPQSQDAPPAESMPAQ